MVVDGRKIYDEIIEETRRYIEALKNEIKKNGNVEVRPKLSIIAIGEDKEMEVYIRNKKKAASICGIDISVVKLDQDVSQERLEEEIRLLNKSDSCGIILQLPLPPHIDKVVLDQILPIKDVDCLTSENLGRTIKDMTTSRYMPCACMAMLDVFERYGVDVAGKYAVVVGSSNLVGKPCANVLLNLGATVSVCHKRTESIERFIKDADIVVSAVGKPHLIRGEWIKKGAVVIDIGTRLVNGKIVGDVEFDVAKERASLITPVPGGVGLITVAELMRNTAKAFYLHAGLYFPYFPSLTRREVEI